LKGGGNIIGGRSNRVFYANLVQKVVQVRKRKRDAIEGGEFGEAFSKG